MGMPQRYGQGYWNGPRNGGKPLGQMYNPAIIGGSASVYSTHVTGMGKYDLLGRGIALCRSIANGRCQGYIPYCCTIERDSLSAMELFVDNDMNGGIGGMGGMGGMGSMGGMGAGPMTQPFPINGGMGGALGGGLGGAGVGGGAPGAAGGLGGGLAGGNPAGAGGGLF